MKNKISLEEIDKEKEELEIKLKALEKKRQKTLLKAKCWYRYQGYDAPIWLYVAKYRDDGHRGIIITGWEVNHYVLNYRIKSLLFRNQAGYLETVNEKRIITIDPIVDVLYNPLDINRISSTNKLEVLLATGLSEQLVTETRQKTYMINVAGKFYEVLGALTPPNMWE